MIARNNGHFRSGTSVDSGREEAVNIADTESVERQSNRAEARGYSFHER